MVAARNKYIKHGPLAGRFEVRFAGWVDIGHPNPCPCGSWCCVHHKLVREGFRFPLAKPVFIIARCEF